MPPAAGAVGAVPPGAVVVARAAEAAKSRVTTLVRIARMGLSFGNTPTGATQRLDCLFAAVRTGAGEAPQWSGPPRPSDLYGRCCSGARAFLLFGPANSRRRLRCGNLLWQRVLL